MEGPILPGGSGGEESPEEPLWLRVRAEAQYLRRLAAFEASLHVKGRKRPRRMFRDFTIKNCEEAWGGSPAGSQEADGLG